MSEGVNPSQTRAGVQPSCPFQYKVLELVSNLVVHSSIKKIFQTSCFCEYQNMHLFIINKLFIDIYISTCDYIIEPFIIWAGRKE